jgi:hypothetical protein
MNVPMEDSSFQLFDRYILLYLYFHSNAGPQWDGQFALLLSSSICDWYVPDPFDPEHRTRVWDILSARSSCATVAIRQVVKASFLV